VESAQVLYERYFESERELPDGFDIEFSAPTSFAERNTNSDLPLPIPEFVFDSWLRRWNKFAGVALPRKVTSMREAKLTLNQFDELKTQPVQLPDELMIGFTGRCRFRLLAKKDEFWARLGNLLADFSFYCGTGAKTTVGLGQTKRL
jgi:CRISPR-associated endoribonuclease Cas6